VDAAQALADLTEISSQIEAAVLAGADGTVLASTFPDESRSRQLANAAQALLAAAERVRGEGGQPLAQLEASTADGSVFVVRDAERVIAATTSAQPTVGLVFYDLKSCLRAAAADAEGDDGRPRPAPKAEAELEDDDDAA
jgi:predicted regulator of Ras-like GTPase activity (Roadblock/LC7/MglB family)